MLKLADRTILVITAHPGDLEWYCGGTICGLAKNNRVIHILAASGGQNGSRPEEAAAIRREQFTAAEVLGIGETVFLDLPEGELAYGGLSTLRVRLYRAMRGYQPQVVLSFDPGNPYEPDPDHTALGRLTLEAAVLHPNPRYCPEERRSSFVRPELLMLFGDYLSEPIAVCATQEWRDRKIAALRCHAARFGPAREEMEAALAAVESEHGARVNAPSGEAFHVLGWAGERLVPLAQHQLDGWRPEGTASPAGRAAGTAAQPAPGAEPGSAKVRKTRQAGKRG